jgi:hypothetical protein
MRESRTYGSVRGALSNERPYREGIFAASARSRLWQILLQKSFCTGDAKMWGTSSPNDKLADDPGNAIEGPRISGRRSDFLTAGKLAPDDLGLLQQYRH